MIILCADDYGLSDSVSRGIIELAAARRISATSAIVSLERWREDAMRLLAVCGTTALGLHLNLTLGRPLVARPGARHLDVNGGLLPVRRVIERAVLRRLDGQALQRECAAQIAAFRDAIGTLPDFIDGHQHVHALPVIRDALIAAIGEFSWTRPPLVRVPSNAGQWLGRTRHLWGKRAVVAGLTYGARGQLQDAELPANDTFAGFSSFTVGSDYAKELDEGLGSGGRCHLVMCHPGYLDDELASRGDPVVARRKEELQGIMAFDGLPERIWHPTREADGSIDWVKAISA